MYIADEVRKNLKIFYPSFFHLQVCVHLNSESVADLYISISFSCFSNF